MTAPSSWRRSFWRVGSMLAAIVGSLMVVAALVRRTPGAGPRPRSQPGRTPVPAPAKPEPRVGSTDPQPLSSTATATRPPADPTGVGPAGALSDDTAHTVVDANRIAGTDAPSGDARGLADAVGIPTAGLPSPSAGSGAPGRSDGTAPASTGAPSPLDANGVAARLEAAAARLAQGRDGTAEPAPGPAQDIPSLATGTNGVMPGGATDSGVLVPAPGRGQTAGAGRAGVVSAPSLDGGAVADPASARSEGATPPAPAERPDPGREPGPPTPEETAASALSEVAGTPPARRSDDLGRARRRRPLVVELAVLGVAVLGVAVVVTTAGGEDGPDTASGAPGGSTTGQPTTTSVDQLTPDQAFAQAAGRLATAGSYNYGGTTSATDVSNVRPGPWVAVDLTVMGQVDLPSGRWREVGVAGATGETAEVVTDGRTLWARAADTAEGLDDVPFEAVRTLADPSGSPVTTGAALLPGWLTATTNRQVAPPGPDTAAGGAGARTFTATLPAAVLGEIETGRHPVDAQVRLTLDAAGDPVHVDVVTGPAGPPLHLALGFRFGEAEPIVLPTEQPTG